MEQILLASGSPRRKELMKQLNLPCTVISADIDETIFGNTDPVYITQNLSKKKIEAVKDLQSARGFNWIVGADTLVSRNGIVFGKPDSPDQAAAMLEALRGGTHEVTTGIALYNVRLREFSMGYETTQVRFADFSDAELEWYLGTREWQGVAGAYRIQGQGAALIEHIDGSYSNVMGLPLRAFYVMLLDNHYPFSN